MSNTDALRWNKRYQEAEPGWYMQPRSFLVGNAHLLPHRGLALDLAMGMGQNSAFLLERGLDVIGLDIAITAVTAARRRSPALMAAVVDLEHYRLPDAQFDLILNLYYLDRAWFAEFWRLLKPGGILVYETLTLDMQADKPELDADRLLQPGELHHAFRDWDILVDREGRVRSDHGHEKVVASLIARRP